MKPFTVIRKEFERWFKQQAKAGWVSGAIERAATRLRCALQERAFNPKVHPSQTKDLAESMQALERARSRTSP